MPRRTAQVVHSPTPSEHSIAPSDSASNPPPTQRFSSATNKTPKPNKRSTSGRADVGVDHDCIDVKPEPSAAVGRSKKAKTEPASSEGARGSKVRVAVEAKRAIAEEIISRGVAGLDVASLAAQTGLTTQQIRSQIADNRNNLRRQLMQLAKSLQ